MTQEMVQYYAARAAAYDRIYDIPPKIDVHARRSEADV
jgi:hypothetical protein